jgi:DNA-3-methyladenine glycosylase
MLPLNRNNPLQSLAAGCLQEAFQPHLLQEYSNLTGTFDHASPRDFDVGIQFEWPLSFVLFLLTRSFRFLSGEPNLQKLDQSFYERPAVELAPDLIGKVIVRRVKGTERRARIVETEAYIGEHDLASHASKGRTQRTEVMFGPAGRAYVYLIYGIHDMFNIVAGRINDPQAVLIRAAEPLNGWSVDLRGPGKLARNLCITRDENGIDLTGDQLHLIDDPSDRPLVTATARIGVEYAMEWKHALLRFLDAKRQSHSRSRRR